MPSRLNDISILSCNFNSEKLTKCMIGSLLTYLPEYDPSKIYILDNSDKCPITELGDPINIIDNTNYKYTPKYAFPSQSHSASISWAFDNVINTKYVILCDNDILFKPSIKDFISLGLRYDCIGEIGYDTVPPNRLFPYLLMINLDKYKADKINFFDLSRCIVPKEHTNEPIASKYGNVYDTGYSFYEDIKRAKWYIKSIQLSDYMIHLKSGSYSNKTWDSQSDT